MVRKTGETLDTFTPTEETSAQATATPTNEIIQLPPTGPWNKKPGKTLGEIEAALAIPYSGKLEQVDGYDYIPWQDATDVANTIFGYGGWISEVVRSWREDLPDPNTGILAPQGYSAIVRVTVFPNDAPTFSRENIGFSELVYTKTGRPLIDSAIKGVVSRASVRTLALFGDAFGLFLYDKGNTQASTGAAPRTTNYTSTTASTGSGSGKPTEKMVYALITYKHVPEDIVNQMDYAQAKTAMDMFSKGSTVTQVLAELGYAAPQTSGTGDRLPIPAGR